MIIADRSEPAGKAGVLVGVEAVVVVGRVFFAGAAAGGVLGAGTEASVGSLASVEVVFVGAEDESVFARVVAFTLDGWALLSSCCCMTSEKLEESSLDGAVGVELVEEGAVSRELEEEVALILVGGCRGNTVSLVFGRLRLGRSRG
jgi:hypothetical protein